jgi:hypothetical protein
MLEKHKENKKKETPVVASPPVRYEVRVGAEIKTQVLRSSYDRLTQRTAHMAKAIYSLLDRSNQINSAVRKQAYERLTSTYTRTKSRPRSSSKGG